MKRKATREFFSRLHASKQKRFNNMKKIKGFSVWQVTTFQRRRQRKKCEGKRSQDVWKGFRREKKRKANVRRSTYIFFSTLIGGSKVRKKERTKERGAVAAATDWPLFDQVQATHLASRISMTSLSLFHSSRLYLTKRFFSLGSRVL